MQCMDDSVLSRAFVLDSMNVGRYEGVVTTLQEYLQCALGCEVQLNPIQLKVHLHNTLPSRRYKRRKTLSMVKV